MRVNASSAPPKPFEIRDIKCGFCTVAMFEGIAEAAAPAAEGSDAPQPKQYEYDEYTVKVPYRESLDNDIAAAPDKWLAAAKDAEAARLAAEIRARRNELLAASDKYMLSDMPTDATKAAWKAYRQALRDMPETGTFPFEVTWPAPPEG